MIKQILVGIDTSEHSRGAQRYAFYLARRLDATLIGLHVVDIVSIEGPFFHDISGSLGLEPYLDLSSRMREVLTARGQAVLEEFAAAARRERVNAEILLDVGVVANQVCERARSADLVMIGHRGVNERFSTGLLGSTTESVARKSPRPLLVSPRQFREINRPVLAYDGSERASRAMRAAAELSALLEVPLAVITVARDSRLGQKTLNEARAYLEPYSVKAEFTLVQGNTHEGIIGFLNQYDADLVFVGSYGHSRFIEMVIGSNTEYVMRNAPCPVFLSR
ncbi:MAG TPA: universal stress protein [Candidatus Binataceae bacterium]|nr:universal stress protein [Candidatus Binataceae bacterium]